jgi:hypothetical protein
MEVLHNVYLVSDKIKKEGDEMTLDALLIIDMSNDFVLVMAA